MPPLSFGFPRRRLVPGPVENINAVLPGDEEDDDAFHPMETINAELPDDYATNPLQLPHDARDRYIDALAGMPQRSKPSVGRRILAALAGGLTGFGSGAPTGLHVTDSILNGNYGQRVNDWKMKTEALGAAAKAEREGGQDIINQTNAISTQERRRAQTTNEELARQLRSRDLDIKETRVSQQHDEAMKRIEAIQDDNLRKKERDIQLKKHENQMAGIAAERNRLTGEAQAWKKDVDTARIEQGEEKLDAMKDPLVKPYAQKHVHEMAKEQLATDNEFGQYYKLSPQGIRTFDLTGIKDPVERARQTKRLKKKIQEIEADIIGKRYSDYFKMDDIDDDSVNAPLVSPGGDDEDIFSGL